MIIAQFFNGTKFLHDFDENGSTSLLVEIKDITFHFVFRYCAGLESYGDTLIALVNDLRS